MNQSSYILILLPHVLQLASIYFCNFLNLCSGCGTVGRVVASGAREPGFKSNHHTIYYIQNIFLFKTVEKKKAASRL